VTTASDIRETLGHLAGLPDAEIDLAGTALALAGLDQPADLEPYRRHLDELAADARGLAEAGADPVAALNGAIVGRHRYAGDERDYDNLDNANLMRVIDRRRGLPVTLGILYIHVARRLGWTMHGLAFPSHFLVRLDGAPGRAILDPFHGGRVLDAVALRDLLKTVAGEAAELKPVHYRAVGNRDILLRLQNNIKLRLLRNGELRRALGVVEGTLLFAPSEALLWREAGMLHLRLDDIPAAIASLEQFVARTGNSGARHRTTALLQELRSRLH
jgi:regulator of sirC expression with transglutaminase-like and TPR domain